MKDILFRLLIIAIMVWGLFLRFNYHAKSGYNVDEMYQLQHVQELNIKDVFKRTTFYGDHTSFPGEFILHYPFLKMSGIFENKAKIETHNLKVDNISTHQLATIIFPKGLIEVAGAVLFVVLCFGSMVNRWAILTAVLLYAFHPNLIRHGLEFRPYGILPELALFNYMAASHFVRNREKGFIKWIYLPLVSFTFVYHAYGILIACLPLIYYWIEEKSYKPSITSLIVFGVSLAAWCYYASYSYFGMTPNTVQSKVNPFQYMPLETFAEKSVTLMFGSMLAYVVLAPLVLFSALRYPGDMLFFCLMIALPIALIMLVDLKTSYWIHPRQWIWTVPFFHLWVGWKIEDLIRGKVNG